MSSFVKWLNGEIGVRPLLRKIPKFRRISWCENFVELHGRFLRNSAWNCAFPQNRHARNLGEIIVFYAVLVSSQKNLPLWCEQNLNWHRTFDWSCPAVITTKSCPTQYFYSLWRISVAVSRFFNLKTAPLTDTVLHNSFADLSEQLNLWIPKS